MMIFTLFLSRVILEVEWDLIQNTNIFTLWHLCQHISMAVSIIILSAQQGLIFILYRYNKACAGLLRPIDSSVDQCFDRLWVVLMAFQSNGWSIKMEIYHQGDVSNQVQDRLSDSHCTSSCSGGRAPRHNFTSDSDGRVMNAYWKRHSSRGCLLWAGHQHLITMQVILSSW